MKTTLSTQTTQKQSQVLAADLIENIHLLELPFNDLLSYLDRVSQDNIFIDPETIMAMYQTWFLEEGVLNQRFNGHKPFIRSDNFYDRDAWLSAIPSRQNTPTLKQHLLWQLGGMTLDPHLKQTCTILIDSLDCYGFLSDPKDEICRVANYVSDYYDKALDILKTLDPPGVASCNIIECLELQIPADHPRKDLLISLVTYYWRDLLQGHLSIIKRGLKLSDQRLALLIRDMQDFRPIPAYGFASEDADVTVACDIVFTVDESGSVDFYLAGKQLEKAPLINAEYASLLYKHTELAYQKEKARKIVRGVKQRYRTLEMLGLYIAEKQRNYFFGGKAALVPLTMQDTAYDLGLSVASISRITKDKYAFTPFGTISLKTFFPQQTASFSIGEYPISQETLRAAIEEIISKEDPLFPVSDIQIAEILEDQYGMIVSRRTVSKYRNRCGILSQGKRKSLIKMRSLL